MGKIDINQTYIVANSKEEISDAISYYKNCWAKIEWWLIIKEKIKYYVTVSKISRIYISDKIFSTKTEITINYKNINNNQNQKINNNAFDKIEVENFMSDKNNTDKVKLTTLWLNDLIAKLNSAKKDIATVNSVLVNSLNKLDFAKERLDINQIMEIVELYPKLEEYVTNYMKNNKIINIIKVPEKKKIDIQELFKR